MSVKTLALPLLSLAAVGAIALTTQFSAEPAVAAPQQKGPPAGAECVYRGAGNGYMHANGNGDTVLYVPRGSPLMRDRGGPRTYYHPEFKDKLMSVELKQGCRSVLFGQFGANWGHRVVRASGPTGAPANHIGGIRCECG